jgi:hypothetical protein
MRPLVLQARVLWIARGRRRGSAHELGLAVKKSVEADEDVAIDPG